MQSTSKKANSQNKRQVDTEITSIRHLMQSAQSMWVQTKTDRKRGKSNQMKQTLAVSKQKPDVAMNDLISRLTLV